MLREDLTPSKKHHGFALKEYKQTQNKGKKTQMINHKNINHKMKEMGRKTTTKRQQLNIKT